jgi:hypothetical protein
MRFVLAALVLLTATARADGEIAGFVTGGKGELSGQVTTLDGKPLATTVHIVQANAANELLVKTDAKGKYSVKLDGSDLAYVFVEEKAKIGGQTVAAVKEGEGEAIQIHEALPPAVPAKYASDEWRLLDYSKAADDANRWARAWLLLSVSDTGQVVRVKLINKPGMDLDAIAIKGAFGLKFEPARDRQNRKIPSYVLWTFEWPASWWLANAKEMDGFMPPSVILVDCGKNLRVQRECSKPNIVNSLKLPWTERPK